MLSCLGVTAADNRLVQGRQPLHPSSKRATEPTVRIELTTYRFRGGGVVSRPGLDLRCSDFGQSSLSNSNRHVLLRLLLCLLERCWSASALISAKRR
jgi:hypothetical protein